MHYDVTIKTIPQRQAACIRMTIPRYEDEGMIWSAFRHETDSLHLVPGDPALCSVIYLDGEYKEHDVEIEAQKTVKGSYPDTEHVRFKTLPPVTVASCTFKGSYTQMPDVYAAVVAWVDENGYAPCENFFNIYHVSPHEAADPRDFVTEVCYPVTPKNAR